MGIGLGCLWVSHYGMGFTSVLADNISANVVGLGLGAVFRFSLYRYWVFSPSRAGAGPEARASYALVVPLVRINRSSSSRLGQNEAWLWTVGSVRRSCWWGRNCSIG